MNRASPRSSPRMFESNLFERFSRAHPLTPAVLYLPVVALSLWLALRQQSASNVLLAAFGGYLAWTMAEYWLHRTLFHLPVVGPRSARLAFLLHGVHHESPWDEMRLVMPAGSSLAWCGLTFAAFTALFGGAKWAPFAGFVLGYVVYDELHWYLHAGRDRKSVV